MSYAFSSLFTVLFTPTAQAASGPSAGELVITEVMSNPRYVGPGNGEWLELTNTSDHSLDLQGLQVSSSGSAGFSVNQALIVASGQSVLLASNSDNDGLPAADFTYARSSLQLSNNSDDVSISIDGTTLDEVDLSFGWGRSTSLSPGSTDASLNNSRRVWCTPTSSYGSGNLGTPGAANDTCPASLADLQAGDLIISELMPTPLGSERGEWIEIQNLSQWRIDLRDLELTTATSSVAIDESVVLQPGAVALIANYSTMNGGLPSEDWAADGQLSLDDVSDTVTISYAGTDFHDVAYDRGIDPIYDGVSFKVDTTMALAGDYETADAWCVETSAYQGANYGTPGDDNGDCGIDVDGDGVRLEADCDDTDPTSHPWAEEVCDGADNDCNGAIDDGSLDSFTYWTDADGDRFGDSDAPIEACELPEGASEVAGDCDDSNALRYPTADEVCDGIDNDCDLSVDESATDATTYYLDEDNDGWGSAASSIAACEAPSGYADQSGDCDDTRWNVRPDASEVCDSLDNDCDGAIDEDAIDSELFYADSDGDGFGDSTVSQSACSQPDGFVRDADDCDDTQPRAYPGANEVCDSIDNDCDGETDEAVLTTWYADADGDLYGDPLNTTEACSVPDGFVAVARDCDDTDNQVNPAGIEVCDRIDNDCNGVIDECGGNTFYTDADGDGFGDPSTATDACFAPTGFVPDDRDCDDSSASVYPGNAESCDDIDNDCDGDIDEGLEQDWFADADEDGFGDSSERITDCAQPEGYVSDKTDCNDDTAQAFPGNTEVCDELDNDCDKQIDEHVTTTYWRDQDGDGFGDRRTDQEACAQPEGFVANSDDCEPSVAEAHPGATEVCDTYDNDCDGQVDEGLTTVFYRDNDGDGFGNPARFEAACEAPPSYVDNADDCNDWSDDDYPGAEETCDSRDNDCDGVTDEEGVATFYLDRDGDGYGIADVTVETCPAPTGYVGRAGDCDDSDPALNPGAEEVCDGIDNNCRGGIDDGVTETLYADADGDGYGDPDAPADFCDDAEPAGYVTNDDDCDDTDADVRPWAAETCDGIDNNCNGQIDDQTGVVGYIDRDGDGFGDPSTRVASCNMAEGYIPTGGDCDDSDADVHPDGVEVCDTIDNDCDGDIDEDLDETFYVDADGDGVGVDTETVQACALPAGYAATSGDCDDSNALVTPGREEVCDGIDNNCNTAIDEGVTTDFYTDADGDGFGDSESVTSACELAEGLSTQAGDCDDADAAAFPGNTETCDEVDNDCDEQIDEGVQTTFYADQDGDGLGDPANTIAACEAPSGYVLNASDCNDTSSVLGDTLTFYIDADGDGHGSNDATIESCTAPVGYADNADDCDDADAGNFPGNTETCDGLDNDCDGVADEAAKELFYADVDADGYGDALSFIEACSAPAGFVSDDTDCDDSQPSINPGMEEVCDELDNNCDDQIDEGVGTTYWADRDVDGYGDPDVMIVACDAQVCETECFFVENAEDCDDDRPDVHPGMTEVCDGIDNDCDTDIDEGLRGVFYTDADGDGYGDPSTPVETCGGDAAAVADNTDCDDGNSEVYPTAPELCDDIDNDCDDSIDEDDVCEIDEPEEPEEPEPTPNRALWVRTDGLSHSSPDRTERHGSADAAALLEEQGLEWDSVRMRDVDFNAELMNDYDVIILFGKGIDGPLSEDQAADLEDFVAEGGGLMYHTFHPSDRSCAMLDSLPESFGLSCVPGNRVLRGAGEPIIDHALTQGINQITINGGEEWEVSGNAQVVIEHTQGYPLVAAAEIGEGRVVAIADEWPLYNEGTSPRWDISAFNNEQLVENSFCWLSSDACDVAEPEQSEQVICSAADGYHRVVDGGLLAQPDASTAEDLGPAAVATWDAHPAWTADIAGAEWIWDEAFETDPDIQQIRTIARFFDIETDAQLLEASLEIAADDSYVVGINGDVVIEDQVGGTFRGSVLIDLTKNLQSGQNRLDIQVTNDAHPGSSGSSNPAGLAYCLTLSLACEADDCSDATDDTDIVWMDADGDGFGDALQPLEVPVAADGTIALPEGYVDNDEDCDDTAATISPAAIEVCNHLDDDCDASVDEDLQAYFWADADSDGFGDPTLSIQACEAPSGFTDNALDCDDTDPSANPDTDEVCDDIDNDCDGNVDEGVLESWYMDVDADGFGHPSQSALACEAFGPYTTQDTSDCDDGDSAVSPDASEVCDAVDNDCDGDVDEGVMTTFYADADGDGFGDPASTVDQCAAPIGYVTTALDCNDGDANTYPGAEDTCDYIDNDCDGVFDEDPEYLYNLDRDGDGYGDPVEVIAACAPPIGYIADDTDCDDTDRSTHPFADELCDGQDNDCDGAIETEKECPAEQTFRFCSAEDGWNRELDDPSLNPDVTTPERLGPWAVEIQPAKRWKATIDEARWIWVSDDLEGPRRRQEATFARPFELGDEVRVISATLEIAADAYFTATINGTEVADSGDGRPALAATEWDVSDVIANGWNRLDVEVESPGRSRDNASPAGLLYCLSVDVTCPDGECPDFTDSSAISDQPEATEVSPSPLRYYERGGKGHKRIQ